MAHYNAPLDDIDFIINNVFKLTELWKANSVLAQRIDSDTATAMLNECAKLCKETIATHSITADQEGSQWHAGKITTPSTYKESYHQLQMGGWCGLTGNTEYGAMGIPKSLSIHCEEMFAAADLSFSLFPMLTAGASLTLDQHGSKALKEKYLPKLYSGEWAGCMCLTEPQAGSDLGLINTKAELNATENYYEISGSKIFITGGDQDLTDNIIHLILAKLPDAPTGAKGISLFLVPKRLDDGRNNGVYCDALEHKMGIKASPTCVMRFDRAQGYLVGEINRGLSAMFTMMNYERLAVGIQGIGPAERSYQCALNYARERLQGRSSTSNLSNDQAESILAHADVRRMLLTMRAFTEGSRCLTSYIAIHLDTIKYSDNSASVKHSDLKVALLTPIAKSFFTDRGFESCVLGQQLLGGHGYMHEWGQEQLVRDVRITQIYEGTNGIQAMDLLMRKVQANRGTTVMDLMAEIKQFNQTASSQLPSLMVDALDHSVQIALAVTDHIVSQTSDDAAATAVYYLDLLGYVLMAYMWAKMTLAATENTPLHNNKRQVAEFYFTHLLPRINGLQQSIENPQQAIGKIDWHIN